MAIGYLGPEGSHSYHAVHRLIQSAAFQPAGQPSTLMHFGSLFGLMEATASETVRWGLLPLENALEGSVLEVVDTLGMQHLPLDLHAELRVPIRHALLALSPEPIGPGRFRRVLSHPQALGQCRQTLQRLLGAEPERVPVASTAIAAQWLGRREEALLGAPADEVAAIAPESAAPMYGLHVLAPDLSDSPDNATRFGLVTRQGTRSRPAAWTEAPQKTSFCLGLRDEPGALAGVLQHFQSRGINLTKIESRPSRRQLGEYLFHLDAEGDLTTPDHQDLRDLLEASCTLTHCIGPYACFGTL